MASSYYDKTGKSVTDGDIAYADDLNQINNAVDTGFQGVETDINNIANDAVTYAALAEKWAEEAEDVEVEPGKYSALHHAAKSEASATSSAASAASATASASAASTSETNAAASEAAAGLSETNAAASEAAALASENKAQEWAENPEDVEVETGQYSALHWAAKSEAAAGAIKDDAYSSAWDGDTSGGASRNALYDKIEVLDGQFAFKVSKTSDSGSAQLPVGTTAQQDLSPITGSIRFNTERPGFEGYDGSTWDSIGGGGAGGLDWTSSVQTTDFTAEVGKGYLIDTTAGIVTMTLPAMVAGDQVAYKDIRGNFDTFHLVISPDGSDLIESVSGDTVEDSKGAGATLTGGDATSGWSVTAHTPVDNFLRNKPYMEVQERQATGVFPSGTPADGDNHKVLNTVIYNDIPGTSLASNLISLDAGDYYIEADSVVRSDLGDTRVRLRIDDSSDNPLVVGVPHSAQATRPSINPTIAGRFTLSTATSIKLILHAGGILDFGLPSNDGADEVYSSVRIWKLDSEIKTITVPDPDEYLKKPLLLLEDRLADGAGPGSITAGYNEVHLTTVPINEIAGATHSGYYVTLPAGTYTVKGRIQMTRGNSTGSSQWSRAVLRKTSDDSVVVAGEPLRTYYRWHGLVNYLEERIVLTESTQLKFELYTDFSDASGWRINNVGDGESSAVATLQIYQEDAVVQAPVTHQPLNAAISSEPVTGGWFGGGISSISGNTVTMRAFSVMDDTLSTALAKDSTTDVAVGTTINQIYHIFAVRYTGDTYGYEVDTDINGANLPGTVTHKRWDTFVLTDSSGVVIPAVQDGSKYEFGDLVAFSTSFTTSLVQYSMASFIPTARVGRTIINFMPNTAAACLASYSQDGTTVTMQVYMDPAQYVLGTLPLAGAGPFYFSRATNDFTGYIFSVELKR